MAAATQAATRLAFHEQSEGRFIVVVLDLRIERVSSHATRGRKGGGGAREPERLLAA